MHTGTHSPDKGLRTPKGCPWGPISSGHLGRILSKKDPALLLSPSPSNGFDLKAQPHFRVSWELSQQHYADHICVRQHHCRHTDPGSHILFFPLASLGSLPTPASYTAAAVFEIINVLRWVIREHGKHPHHSKMGTAPPAPVPPPKPHWDGVRVSQSRSTRPVREGVDTPPAPIHTQPCAHPYVCQQGSRQASVTCTFF